MKKESVNRLNSMETYTPIQERQILAFSQDNLLTVPQEAVETSIDLLDTMDHKIPKMLEFLIPMYKTHPVMFYTLLKTWFFPSNSSNYGFAEKVATLFFQPEFELMFKPYKTFYHEGNFEPIMKLFYEDLSSFSERHQGVLKEFVYLQQLKTQTFFLDITYQFTETSSFLGNINALSCELFLFIAIICLLLYGLIFSTKQDYKNGLIVHETIYLTIISLIIASFLIYTNPYNSFAVFNESLKIDHLSNITKLITILSAIFCLFMSLQYLQLNKINSYEYGVLVLIAILGSILLISSNNFLSLYLAIETQTLTFYILTTFKKNSAYSTEAGLKYFILGALASGFLLFGISLVYGMTGTINFENIKYVVYYYFLLVTDSFMDSFLYFNTTNIFYYVNTLELQIFGLFLGIIFIITSLLFKLTAAPFHMWAPDVYEGAPTPITAFFAIVPKLGIFVILLKLIFHSFFWMWVAFEHLVMIASILSMFIGAFSAFQQQTIKRLFVYSSISHIGYMLIGLISQTALGVQSLFLYIMVYMLTSIILWTLILSLEKADGSGHIKYLTDLTGLNESNPVIAFIFAITLFSMAGIPPLAGFYPKLLLFMSALKGNVPLLGFFSIFSSLISTFYYLRLIKIMFFDVPEISLDFKDIPRTHSIIIAINFMVLVLFFILPVPLLLISHKLTLATFLAF